ncbi:MAG TPA: RNB domain-containing ribonuclease [Thermoanaerobaculia bacterium]|nr:RNB domain-containing ribonuclease [Thermoanaerobaculia bacterium]
MVEKGLEPDFSRDALAELGAIRGAAPPDGGSGARDLRDRLWVSIDNDDSKDLDQLTVAERLDGGAVKIFVAIADVDALVAKGTALDGHARTNTTSVYTAAEIFPMLPERLSTDLTSLGEGEDRLSVVVEMTIGADGAIRGSDVYRAAVKNRAKLAYDSVSVGLDGGEFPEKARAVAGVPDQLQLQDGVAQKLKTRRHEQGALDLETIEPRAVFSGDAIVDLALQEKNRARQLIEDFMIAANGVTARFLAARNIPSLRRVVRSPERWAKIASIAAEYGERLPSEPDCAALQAFLEKRRRADPLRFPDLSLVIVKLMGAGEYVVEKPGAPPIGHFGLAVRDYTHSTAPNRRFPDLITQRLLKAALAGSAAAYSAPELEGLAAHCTEQEDDANKVERQVRKSAAALLLEKKVGQRFDAVVTGASEKGTWVRIFEPPAEGKLVHGFDGLEVGDRVRVKLIGTDVERGFIDFVRVG